jgi:hypoxanthine phosphoribosyltransferase
MDTVSLGLLYGPERITERVDAIAARINNDYAGKDVLAVCVLKGAFLFFAELMKRLTVSPEVEFIRLSSYGDGDTSSGSVAVRMDIESDVRGRDILIVEDIVDTGLSMDFLLRHLQARGAKTLRIATLIDKVERRQIPVTVDYACFSLSKGFIVGFGLDYAERYRELNGIYTLEPGK